MNSKKTLLALAVLVFIGLGLFIFIGRNNSPLSDKKHGFQFYVPQKLPSGQQLHESRVNIIRYGGKTYGITASINLRKAPHNWIYAIDERRLLGSDHQKTKTKLSNFDQNSVEPTCMQRSTLQKQTYRLCHWIDHGQISAYEINFAKDKTYISTTFPVDLKTTMNIDELDHYVDSFKPSDPPREVNSGI